MRGLPRQLRRLVAPVGVLLAALLLTSCNAPSFGEFRGATKQGQDEFKLWVGMFIAGLVVAGIVWLLIFWSVGTGIRKRRREKDGIPRQFSEHIPLEIVYTIIPFVIVFGIFYFTVLTENNITNLVAHPDYVVDIQGFQWGWEFQYENHDVTVITHEQGALAELAQDPTNPVYPTFELPLGQTTQVNLSSNDVAHSLWIPAFNYSQMALPGNVNHFDFTPTHLGVYAGRCNQYCGLYHGEMLFNVKVVTPQQFQQWLQRNHGLNSNLPQLPNGGPYASKGSNHS